MSCVLIGVDGSEASRNAMGEAARIAEALGAKLKLVHVRRPTLVSSEGQPTLAPRIEEELRADSLRLLEQEHAYLAARGPAPDVEMLTLCGNEAEQLSRVAADPEVELLVVGTHGRGALGRLFLGSVASSLARMCPRPLLVVPPSR